MTKLVQNALNLISIGLFIVVLLMLQSRSTDVPAQDNVQQLVTPIPTETFPPSTPLPTLTPSQTLRPPPTFEPPTLTPPPSATPTATATQVFQINAELEGVHGLETATPTSTPGCKPRADWKLTYEVQPNDALERIATAYSTTSDALAEGNCLRDKNMIVVGQKLRVPGETHPQTPQYVCVPWEVLTPINGAYNVDGEGQLTFNWRGPRAERNLIRVIEPDGEIWERVVDLRQNETINLADELPEEGVYTWFVFPLDMNFVQIPCKEGGPWTFHKGPGPTPTPTPELTSTLMPALP